MTEIEDCAIISSDRSMRLLTAEGGLARPAIEQCNGKVFFLSGTSRADRRRLEEQAFAIIQAQKDICRFYRRFAHTYFFGRIHLRNRVGEVQHLCAGTRRQRATKEEVA